MDYSKLYINGEWINSKSKDFIEIENPATREFISKVPRSNSNDVNYAIESAKQAFETWQFVDVKERIGLMNNLLIELNSRIDIMSKVIRDELGCGLSIAKSLHIIPYIDIIKDMIKIAEQYNFEEEYDTYTVRKEPIGVIGALTPWNYPFGQIIKKIIPAMLTGNTVVLKPSQNAPLVSFYIAEAIDMSGFPKGVFNLVTGKGSEVGNLIAKHKEVSMITFTGSTSGGIEVSKIALDDVKRIALELGGKSASIILKGADYKLAIKKTLDKVYLNTGQTCAAYTRLLIPLEDKEEIERLVVEMTKEYRFGDPSDPETIIGPLASKQQFNKVSDYIKLGLKEGAKLLIGEVPKDCSKGYYVGPTVFTDVNNEMIIAKEEIFGPVLCIITYEGEDKAVRLANNSDYGLSGAVFGTNEDAQRVARLIKTGTIVVNEGIQTHRAPFGGYKQSGIGRECSVYGLEEFLEIKSIYNNARSV